MLFKDWFDNSHFKNYMKEKYGSSVVTWFSNRFANYELLYSEEVFLNIFGATVMECHIELLKLQRVLDIAKIWEMGTTNTTSANSTTTSNSDSTQSYSGYNVEGDFAKSASTGNMEGTSTGNSKTLNYTDEYNKLLFSDYTTILNNIYNKFIKLFVTVL